MTDMQRYRKKIDNELVNEGKAIMLDITHFNVGNRSDLLNIRTRVKEFKTKVFNSSDYVRSQNKDLLWIIEQMIPRNTDPQIKDDLHKIRGALIHWKAANPSKLHGVKWIDLD